MESFSGTVNVTGMLANLMTAVRFYNKKSGIVPKNDPANNTCKSLCSVTLCQFIQLQKPSGAEFLQYWCNRRHHRHHWDWTAH